MTQFSANYDYTLFKGAYLLFLSTFAFSSLNAQQARRIQLVNSTDGEPFIAAEVYIDGVLSTVSDETGSFTFPCSDQEMLMSISYFGQSKEINILPIADCTKNTVLRVALSIDLAGIEVLSNNSSTTSSAVYAVEQLTSPPSLLGQPDILRGLALRSGITHGQEGNANLFVRGGTPDQNLVLLDDAPVYNLNHLGGFLSVFNDNAIKTVGVYKTTPPLAYGNRLSSVIDVRLRNGSEKRWRGKAGIGIISADLYLEGPIVKEQTTVVAGLRLGYFDLVNIGVDKDAETNFFDLRMSDYAIKISHQFSEKHRLFVSSYRSNDVDGFGENARNVFVNGRTIDRQFVRLQSRYGNQTFSIRDYVELGNNAQLTTYAYYTNYRNELTRNERLYDSVLFRQNQEKVFSRLRDFGVTTQVQIGVSNSTLRVGLSANGKKVSPLQVTIDDAFLPNNPSTATGTTTTAFAGWQTSLSPTLTTSVGGRLSRYSRASYTSNWLEARFRLDYQLSNRSWLSFSANTAGQDIHLISSGALGQSTDAYLLPNSDLPVQTGYQIDGSFSSRPYDRMQLRVGAYYRQMKDVLFFENFDRDAQTSANLISRIERGGNGRSLGLETEVEYSIGPAGLLLAYTLSSTQQRFSNFNNNEYFPFRYDRPHDLSLVLTYRLNKKYQLNSNFIYQSGIAVTTPVARIPASTHVPSFSAVTTINNARFPPYHRLDVAIQRDWHGKRGKENTLRLSIYNVYNRVNASYYNSNAFSTTNNNGEPVIQVTNFRVGRIGLFPSIYYAKAFGYDTP